MKKLFLLLLAMIPLMLLAQQDTTGLATDIPVPGSFIDVFSDLQGWFASTTAVAGLTIFITLFVAKLTPLSAIWKQVVALIIALILMAVGNMANIGFMADFNVVSTVVYGIVTGFVANGLYDLKNVARTP